MPQDQEASARRVRMIKLTSLTKSACYCLSNVYQDMAQHFIGFVLSRAQP